MSGPALLVAEWSRQLGSGFAAKLEGFAPMTGQEKAEAVAVAVAVAVATALPLRCSAPRCPVEGEAKGGDHSCHWERARGCLRGLGPAVGHAGLFFRSSLSPVLQRSFTISEDFTSKRHLVEAVLDQEVSEAGHCMPLPSVWVRSVVPFAACAAAWPAEDTLITPRALRRPSRWQLVLSTRCLEQIAKRGFRDAAMHSISQLCPYRLRSWGMFADHIYTYL